MQRILFVCTGNTCRSPMAEAILKNKNLEGIEVRSAGIFAIDGNEASAHAKKVIEENQIVHNHQSSLLTGGEVGWADLILTMTDSHKDAILINHPESAAKLFTLKEFAGETVYHDVSDPYGGNISIYRETFQELEQLIDRVIEKLTKNT
ncbi:low molecular weight protein arginine phosphatase [Neobacillus niacini]|uniref:low molecular weight protein arginine phosphatase n=1 Tax=Neobacillus niacini TaxID=86668 RepID=UPI002865891E|nr:low molecular weight protein arginine phosphatase [Neobacillus niacini]MDR6999372.1 protein-tyrosine phosphatase [Neobacillus niacini]